MARAELRIELVEDDGEPPDDSCVIWLRANPGLPEAPLAATASGGELSRVLLALHGVAAGSDDGHLGAGRGRRRDRRGHRGARSAPGCGHSPRAAR